MKHRRLQRLARAKKLLEERESLEFEGRRRRLAAADDRLEDLRRCREQESGLGERTSAHDLRMDAAWRAGLAEEERARVEDVQREAARVEAGRLELLAAHKARRVAENAHERARREWVREQEDARLKVNDALASVRYARAIGSER